MYTGKSKCLNCGQEYDSERLFEGCPHCRNEQFVSNITPVYQLPAADGSMASFTELFPGNRLEDYREILPFRTRRNLIDLGVGNTALNRLDRIGEELKQISGITSCHFISGDEAWDAFREAYLNDDIADTFTENPLQDSFNYRLSVRLNADTQAIRDEISQINGVRLIQNLSELKQASLK